MHYFVESKKLGSAFVATELEGPAVAKAEPEQAVPPRIIVHTKMHINAMMCAALIAVLIMSYYSSITTILRLKRWYAVTVLLLVPVGAYFFSFAVNTAVCGVFSIFLGEPQQAAAGSGADTLRRQHAHIYGPLSTARGWLLAAAVGTAMLSIDHLCSCVPDS
jgi:hypothetical protein